MVSYEEILMDLALRRRLPHAIIIEDKNNKYALESVMQMIKIYFCESEYEKPCDKCGNCVKMRSGSHIDVKILEGSYDEKILIGKIRELRLEANVGSSEGHGKFYILNNADFFPIRAQNAFIKILEEPPNNVIFVILCNSAMSLLSTIRSRCIIYSSCSDMDSDKLEICSLADKILDLRFKNNVFEILKIVSELKSDRMYLKILTEFIIEKLIYRFFSGSMSGYTDFEGLCDKINELKFLVESAENNINISLFKNYILANL